jgi:hypothetical protein
VTTLPLAGMRDRSRATAGVASGSQGTAAQPFDGGAPTPNGRAHRRRGARRRRTSSLRSPWTDTFERGQRGKREGEANESRVRWEAAAGFPFDWAKTAASHQIRSDGHDSPGRLRPRRAKERRPESRPRPRLRPGRGSAGEHGKWAVGHALLGRRSTESKHSIFLISRSIS